MAAVPNGPDAPQRRPFHQGTCEAVMAQTMQPIPFQSRVDAVEMLHISND